MIKTTIGVDISKDVFDAHRLPDGAQRQFANDKTGWRAFIKWLDGSSVERIVFEATGAYHRAFEQAIDKAGLPLCKVNPRLARRFGEALGKLAKTDRMDAAMLARFGTALQPPVRPAPTRLQCDLKELLVARMALVKDRTAAKNRQKNLSCALLKRHAEQRLKQIERQIDEVETAIRDLIEANPDLARRFRILTSIPGIAERAAFALIIDMPELGSLDARAAAGLSGTAPMTRKSGKKTGKAFVQGGRPNVRAALYMPALVAARFNPDLKAKYNQLLAAGKPAKVALTAVMRKLVILANALIRDDRSWSPGNP
jgi:transposase